MYIFDIDNMYTPIIPVCDSNNLNRSESCEPRCRNETACCATIRGNDTSHQCFEYNGETSIERCEPGNILISQYYF